MAEVTLTNVLKNYNPSLLKDTLRNINLDIKDGEFIVFVGPSGCGKSTLLRMIAGLEDITSGELKIGSKVMNDVPPVDRGVGMVFQSYALYPHMDVRQKMEFGLKLKKFDKDTIEIRRVYVKKRYRRKGIAYKLIKQLEKLAMEENFKYSVIETGRENTAAINLYKKLDYEVIDSFGMFEGDDFCICMKKQFKSLIV